MAAVIPQYFKFFVKFIGIRGDHAAITKSAQVFGREKTETAASSHGSGPMAPVFRSDGLGRILDHGQTMFCSHLKNRGHFGALPV